jgi:homoserine O-succinyltransferase
MAIIINYGHELYLADRLRTAGALTISEEDARKQNMRPARIGLLNLMPAATMQAAEVQWLRYISNTLLQVEPVLIKFDDDPRATAKASRESILANYLPFSEVIKDGLDGLIITSDKLELDTSSQDPALLAFSHVIYGEQLKRVIDWAQINIFSTVYSGLASHFALNHLYGLEREAVGDKYFGVFEHQVYHNGVFSAGLDDTFRAPHSRWGNIKSEALKGAGLTVMAEHARVGWLFAAADNVTGGRDLYIQGHPEYGRGDLDAEYRRDAAKGLALPVGYYPESDPNLSPVLSWANDARALHANWIGYLYDNHIGKL